MSGRIGKLVNHFAFLISAGDDDFTGIGQGLGDGDDGGLGFGDFLEADRTGELGGLPGVIGWMGETSGSLIFCRRWRYDRFRHLSLSLPTDDRAKAMPGRHNVDHSES